MRRRWGALFFTGMALLGGCDGPSAKAPETRPVRTVTVDPKPIEDDRQAVGEVRARYESDLGFRVSGKVTARLVDVGVSVKKGAVLARLDEQEYRNKLKSAEADIVAAEAVLVEAQGSEGRLRQLVASGTTTRANYDTAVKNLRSAEAKLELGQGVARPGQGPAQLYRPHCRVRRHRHRNRRRARAGRERRPDGRSPGAPHRQGRRVQHCRIRVPDTAGAGRHAHRGRSSRCSPIRASRPKASCARSRRSPIPRRAPFR